jgi:hypothetical protein
VASCFQLAGEYKNSNTFEFIHMDYSMKKKIVHVKL